ncbi:MAG: hypothetical protein ABW007_19070 [Chitinophagaceae bacterium]
MPSIIVKLPGNVDHWEMNKMAAHILAAGERALVDAGLGDCNSCKTPEFPDITEEEKAAYNKAYAESLPKIIPAKSNE